MESRSVASPGEATCLTIAVALGEPSVITVTGDSDIEGTTPLRQAIDGALAHHPHLVLDLGAVTFADSTFLASLLLARESALERGGSVRLLAVSANVQRLLDIIGAASLFPAVTAAELKQS